MAGTDTHRREETSAAALLEVLRGEPARRPRVDPGLAGGLREWLEDEMAPVAAGRPAGSPALTVDRRLVAGATAAEEPPGGGPGLRLNQVRGLLLGTLFRQLVTTGRIGHPLEDALAGLSVTGRGEAVSAFLASRSAAERSRLRRELADQAARMARRWPSLTPFWLPRTGEHLTVPLAGGRIVLSGLVDLLIGAPANGRASVCLVEVSAGTHGGDRRLGLRFLALLETLRSGAAPARVATFDAMAGELEAEEVTETALCQTVDLVVHQVHRTRQAGHRTAPAHRGEAGDPPPPSAPSPSPGSPASSASQTPETDRRSPGRRMERRAA